MKALFIRIVAMTLFLAGAAFAQVSEQWVQRFTSDSTRNDAANDMFVDSQGNVYVTGSQRQVTNFDMQAVTVKYNSQGVQQWIQNYVDTMNHGAVCRAIHVDGAGNVYVTGDAGVSGPPYSALVIKYSPSGTQLWSYRFKYTAFGVDRGYDIITDLTGNVYVTGEYTGDANNIFLVKFDPDGHLVNQTAFHRASEGARRIGLDGAGKIIVGGYINDNDSLSYIVLKYEQNLDFVWAARWGRGVGNQNVIDMAIDINSNIIVTGTNSLLIDFSTVKINPAGVVDWGRLYTSAFGWDMARAVVTDNVGNIYVAGDVGTAGLPLTYDFCTVKYAPNGDQQWARTLKPAFPPTGIDGFSANEISLDNSANIYVTGNGYAGANMITAKYNPAGTLQWAKSYSGSTANSGDYAVGVGVDGNGNVYTVGNSNNNNYTTGNDIAIIKYAPAPFFTTRRKKNSINKPIFDNQATLDTVTVDYTSPVDYRVMEVNVTLDTVLHSRVSDLEFVLTHNGVSDTLIYQVGGTGQNFTGTILDDSAATSIATGTAPFTGSFRPARPLSQFNDLDVNGIWVLSIFDHAAGNTGSLQAWSLDFTITSTTTGVGNTANGRPDGFSLEQNFPNPFNPSTKIVYRVRNRGSVDLKVFDVLGGEVATLVNEEKEPGEYTATFDAPGLSSGIYFYRLQAGESVQIRKLVLLK